MGVSGGVNTTSNGGILPYLALLASQLITSSWHVLGKHVMHQVPYLTPIAFVLVRTLTSTCILLTLGRFSEGRVSFPPLFSETSREPDGLSTENGLNGSCEKRSLELEDGRMENGLSSNAFDTAQSLNGQGQNQNSNQRTRRKKSAKNNQLNLLRKFLTNTTTHNTITPTINPEIKQLIAASLTGMLSLPLLYTTGLILTNPTVASVWDGPMIPLGVFCVCVWVGAEKMSRKRPLGQVLSLLLTVGGSLVVLLVDFMGAHNSIKNEEGLTIGHASHWEFIRGNIVLMGIMVAYSAMSLLQKQLTHFPPITLTGWMFGCAHCGCWVLLIFDSFLQNFGGASVTGCTVMQAMSQLKIALGTSPTFRYGMLYAAFFVGGTCFSIMNYASAHLDSSVITLFAAIQPPITAVLEWIWEGKELGAKKIFGMICVCIGMFWFTDIKQSEVGERRHKKTGHRHRSKKFDR